MSVLFADILGLFIIQWQTRKLYFFLISGSLLANGGLISSRVRSKSTFVVKFQYTNYCEILGVGGQFNRCPNNHLLSGLYVAAFFLKYTQL